MPIIYIMHLLLTGLSTYVPKISMRTRLAPTPSGHLHLGNAMSFLLTWLTARSAGGDVFLRFDDLDGPRVKTDFIDSITEDLHWLGLDWEASWFQSKRTAHYDQWLRVWRDAGLIYACHCTRSLMDAEGTAGHCVGNCRTLELPLDGGNPWRLKLDRGDVIVRRREGIAAYHLASLVDDAEYSMDFIVRGEDLRESTAVQLSMARSAVAVGLASADKFINAKFVHHALITGQDGRKLSKSRGDAPLGALRAAGQRPSYIYKMFLRWQGLEAADIETIDQLQDSWSERSLY